MIWTNIIQIGGQVFPGITHVFVRNYIENCLKDLFVRCNNGAKETMIYMDNMNTTYQDIITSFVLNTVLHHVGMLWII